MAAIVRSIKNYAKGFSDVQIKVREATSNDPDGPSPHLMNEIAQLTNNKQDFLEIMDMLDKRLNDKGRNWRHVYKALIVLDYCLHEGSENVVLYTKENLYVVKTLKEFQHIDEYGKDVGYNVRQKAKELTDLLLDVDRLKTERKTKKHVQRLEEDNSVYHQPGVIDEEADLRKAIELSRKTAELESFKREASTDDDAELARVLEESKAEALKMENKQRETADTDDLIGSFDPFPSNNTTNPFNQQSNSITYNSSDPSLINNPYQQYFGSEQNLQAQMTGIPPYQFSMPYQQQQPLNYQPQFQPQYSINQPLPTGTPFSTYPSSMMGVPSSPFQPQQHQSTETNHNPFVQSQLSTGMFGSPSQPATNFDGSNRSDGVDTFGNRGNLRIPFSTGYASTLSPNPFEQGINRTSGEQGKDRK
ncbi:hypothetical protein BDB01DRAFT_613804 [Pilobolus umbonatus]|nr:hypothetical protein BDB01DRAFT_613804 [Pilobolus umbonatus]